MNETLIVVVVAVLLVLVFKNEEAAAGGVASGAPPAKLPDGSSHSGLYDTATGLSTAGCKVGSVATGNGGVAAFCKYTPFNIAVAHRAQIAQAAKATYVAASTVPKAILKPISSGVSSGVKAATHAVGSAAHTVLGWL